MMDYKSRTQDNYEIITLTGEVDLQTSPRARKQMLQAMKNNQHVLLEMSAVEYIDSSGIASLVEGYQDAKSRDLKFGLVNISTQTRQVLALARLDTIFQLFDSVSDGIAAP